MHPPRAPRRPLCHCRGATRPPCLLLCLGRGQGQERGQLRLCRVCLESVSALETARGRDAPQPPLLARVRQQPGVEGFGGRQARKWTLVASWQWLHCPGEVAQLGVCDYPCACGVDVVFVRVGRGAQGIAFPQAEPRPWAAPHESTSVSSPGTCLVCTLQVWGEQTGWEYVV